ncbi:tetratricopeptide repeat protein [Prosthecobacter sp.]|uniref:tetratricopeptide repeat protein n=1 Tax=Prosthecobacter sp. TaxID=1965333 RepID=UPI00378503DB
MIEDFIHETRFRIASMLDRRKPLDGLLGLPAFFTLVVLAFMVISSRTDISSESLGELEREAQGHLDKGHFVEARIAAMRLMQEGMQNSKALLIEAKALCGMGRENDALRLLSRMAPVDRPGHAPAHVIQATILLAQKNGDVQAASQHINNALLSDPSNQDATELAARFAAGRRDWKTALSHLNQMSLNKRADLMLMKATALQFTGQENDAVKFAAQAEEALRLLQKSVPSHGNEVRFSIAASLSLQRKFEEAVQWILSGVSGKPTKEERQIIGGIYLSWSRYLKEQPAADRMEVLHLLEQGIQVSPESQDLIMAFLGDCEELTSTPADRQRYMERILGNGGIATSFLHYHMGVQEWKKGNRDAAKSHFELASSLNPGFKAIGNNLAMAIASVSSDRADLEKALAIINELIQQEPENPFFLDTRGHVLAKMGQFKEAVSDFERSLPHARDKNSSHVKLADLYERLGMTDLASEHRSASLAHMASAGGANPVVR